MARELVVAAIQTSIYTDDEERVLSEAEALLRRAAEKGARLLCLPEHWLDPVVLAPENAVYRKFSWLAQELGAYLNLGAIYEKGEGGVRLTSPTFSPKGEVLARQDKVHLYGREVEAAIPGDGFRPFEVEGSRVGVMVCHDAVFPESARSLVLRGAEVLLVPSMIAAKGAAPWLVYLRARALENRVPVISPNVYRPPKFQGRSVVIDLRYDQEEEVMELHEESAGRGTGVVVVKLDLEDDERPRSERLAEMRPEAYHGGGEGDKTGAPGRSAEP